MSKRNVLILILLIFSVGIGFVILKQSYPVAYVNGQPISARNFNNDFNIGIHYYQTEAQTYDKAGAAAINSPEVKQEIKKAVLDKSIENILILNELEKRLKNSELGQMVENKIGEILNGQDIAKQVATIYNLTLDAFKERILIPQARLEILQARLALENINFDDWLKNAKKQARMIILIPGFSWNGEGIVIK